MKARDIRYQLMMIAVVDLVILTLGVVGAAGVDKFFGLGIPGSLGDGHPGFLSLAVAAIALITFFGLLRLGEGSTLPSESHLRRAITVAVVTVYIVIVSIATFYVPWGEEYSEVSKTLLNSFTTTVGVIVVFFFGSSAYVEAHTTGKHEERRTSQSQDDA